MPTEQNENSADEDQIRALIEDLAERVRTKDINGVLSHYAVEKAQFLLAPPLRHAAQMR
jgi:ketosteroid isomerase-like protein